MSENLTFPQMYSKVAALLVSRELGSAIDLLKQMTEELGDWQLLDEVSNLSSAYGLLLYYMEQGTDDPAREEQYTNFIATAYRLADMAWHAKHVKNNAAVRKHRSMEEVLKELEHLGLKNITSQPDAADASRNAELCAELFDAAFYSPLWNDEAEAHAQAVIDTVLIDESCKAVAVSGLFLSCLNMFDCRKALFFANNYATATDDVLRARLLVALALVLDKYKDRLDIYPAIATRIKLLCDDAHFTSDLHTLQRLLVETCSTLEVNKKMSEEIIPAMLKNHKFDVSKFGIDSFEEIIESNPDWKSFEKEVGKLAELEAGGADIYYATFSALKRYSFFNTPANWLFPFKSDHPAVAPQTGKIESNGIAKILLKSETLCDSDKYSFCLLTSQMNGGQMGMISSQFPEMSESVLPGTKSPEMICRNYLRDLFRFFNLCSCHAKPANPFANDISLIECDVVADAFNNKPELNRIGSLALRKEKFVLAIPYFKRSLEIDDYDAETCQKIGYCYEKEKMYEDAITSYEQSIVIDGGSKWSLLHLANTNRMNGDTRGALRFYKQAELRDDKDAKIAMRCGECHVRFEEYDQAMSYFFKAEYINPNLTSALRAIAWCSILTENFSQARKYYDKLLMLEENADDLINAGHAAWISKDVPAAINFYTRAAKLLTPPNFTKKFFADWKILNNYCITRNDIHLMNDLISRK